MHIMINNINKFDSVMLSAAFVLYVYTVQSVVVVNKIHIKVAIINESVVKF
jgi:hypothetical protein